MATMFGGIAEDFAAADADADGIMSEAESAVFTTKMIEREVAAGKFGEKRPTEDAEMYAICNGINSERDGYSLPEFICFTNKLLEMWGAKAAAEQ
mmetsp:Transcript_34789/g.45786  ORF Transcript_34789/g.45786 Transcript_34789/m.45786 type:complete len:95 (+) Transcript_34789:205-489(+)